MPFRKNRPGRRVAGPLLAAASTVVVMVSGGAASAAPTGSTAGQEDARTRVSAVRQAVVEAAEARLGRPYVLEYGWTCRETAMDCECFNRNAVWHGTKNATGTGLQLNYWLQGQINQGKRTNNPRPGDLIFWDTDPNDGIPYGGDLDHTGVYVGGNRTINANAVADKVQYNSTTLGGGYPNPIFVDVLTPNGY